MKDEEMVKALEGVRDYLIGLMATYPHDPSLFIDDLDKALAALESEKVLAEGYLYNLGYRGTRLTWGRFSTAEPHDAKDVCLPVRILAVKEGEADEGH